MQVTRNGATLAQAPKEQLIYIEGNWYFPPDSVRGTLRKSDTPYICPWKGTCQYFDIKEGDAWAHDIAWSYHTPKTSAIEIVKKDFSNYVAFDPQQVSIEKDNKKAS